MHTIYKKQIVYFQLDCEIMVPVVAAVGISGSGKTTILEYLISNLTAEGYRVGSIKHTHHKSLSMDTEGSNTYRYTKAGAEVVAAVSPEEADVIKKFDEKFRNFDNIIGLLEDEKLDVIFIEGFHSLVAKRSDVAKIITAVFRADLEQNFQVAVQPILAITGMITEEVAKATSASVPFIKFPSEGQQLLEIVKHYLKQNA